MNHARKYTFCHPIEVAAYVAILDREDRERRERREARKNQKKKRRKPDPRPFDRSPLSEDELDEFADRLRLMVSTCEA